jgi:hypothetical protein
VAIVAEGILDYYEVENQRRNIVASRHEDGMDMHRESVFRLLAKTNLIRELPVLQVGRIEDDLSWISDALAVIQQSEQLAPADAGAVFAEYLRSPLGDVRR